MQESSVEQQVKDIANDAGIQKFGYAILFFTFGILGVWSFVAPIDGAALAQGYVAVKNNSKTIQHFEGGIVESIKVEEGSEVKSGDVLLKLDTTQIKAQQEIYKGQYVIAKSIKARLLAEQKKLSQIAFPDDLREANNSRVIEVLTEQRDIFNARMASREGERQVLGQRIEQLDSKYTGMQGQKKSNQALLKSLLEEAEELDELLKEGFADKRILREKLRETIRVEGDVSELTASLAQVSIQKGETKLQIIQLEKDANKEIANELASVKAELFDVSEKLRVINSSLARTSIQAPVSGTVINLEVHTEGGVVAPGATLLTIVPEGQELTILAEVSPVDIDRLVIGQEAEVRFSAFNQKTTPKLFGKVLKLSPDRIINEQTGMPYYLAEVTLLPSSLDDISGLELIPGMPAEVLIGTGERSLFEYLAKPITDAFTRSFLEE
ncbi:hypothetical protein A9Q82_02795 [Cycloclasticus sp. 46_120_T64]|nr:hypothetical protein A9Q82_02795 [Cycloclasticus sp. 46_120_T64]